MKNKIYQYCAVTLDPEKDLHAHCPPHHKNWDLTGPQRVQYELETQYDEEDLPEALKAMENDGLVVYFVAGDEVIALRIIEDSLAGRTKTLLAVLDNQEHPFPPYRYFDNRTVNIAYNEHFGGDAWNPGAFDELLTQWHEDGILRLVTDGTHHAYRLNTDRNQP